MDLVFANKRNFILPRIVTKYRFRASSQFKKNTFLRTNFLFHFSPFYLILFIRFMKSFNYCGIVLQSRNDDRENFILTPLLYFDWKISALSSSHLFFSKSPHLFTLLSLHILLNLFIPPSRFISIFQYFHFSIFQTFHLSFTPFAIPHLLISISPPFLVSVSPSFYSSVSTCLHLFISSSQYLSKSASPALYPFISPSLNPSSLHFSIPLSLHLSFHPLLHFSIFLRLFHSPTSASSSGLYLRLVSSLKVYTGITLLIQ
jgi:hypothetical protein